MLGNYEGSGDLATRVTLLLQMGHPQDKEEDTEKFLPEYKLLAMVEIVDESIFR